MSERQGIEIDYCPKCRGVWLDRGELDKIIERAAAEQPATPSFLGGVAQQQGGASFLPPPQPARFLPDQGGPGPWGGQHRGHDDHGRGRGSPVAPVRRLTGGGQGAMRKSTVLVAAATAILLGLASVAVAWWDVL